jgi:hypothetical protein
MKKDWIFKNHIITNLELDYCYPSTITECLIKFGIIRTPTQLLFIDMADDMPSFVLTISSLLS